MENTQHATFSTLLIEALKAKGLSVEELAEKTGISERFINLLFEERLKELPSLPYLRGYVFRIADELGINGSEFWDTYFKNNELLRSSGHSDRLPENRFALARINKKVVLGVVIVFGIIIYLIVRSLITFDLARALILPDFKDEHIIVNEPSFEVRGTVNPSYQLTVNDELIYPDVDGNFQITLKLQPGFNTVVFEVQGLLGKTTEVVKQLFYEILSEPVATTTREF